MGQPKTFRDKFANFCIRPKLVISFNGDQFVNDQISGEILGLIPGYKQEKIGATLKEET